MINEQYAQARARQGSQFENLELNQALDTLSPPNAWA